MPVLITSAGPVVAVAGETYIIDPSVNGAVTFTFTATPANPTPPDITVSYAADPQFPQTITFQGGITSTVDIAAGVDASDATIDASAGGATHVTVADGARLGNVTGSNAADSVNVATGATIGDVSTGDGADSVSVSGTATSVDGGAGADVITTTASANVGVVQGGLGNDILNIGGTVDIVDGGAGNDQITTTEAADVAMLSGGAGDDTMHVSGSVATVDGGAGADNITTTMSANVGSVQGGLNNDTMNIGGTVGSVDAGDGADNVTVSGTVTSVDGGTGNDQITTTGTANVGTLSGGTGNDTMNVAGNVTTVDGGAGADNITVSGTVGTIDGGVGNDQITTTGTANVDTLSGGADSDTINVDGTVTHVDGGDGNDAITTAATSDVSVVDGGAGIDSININASTDTVLGGAGADHVIVADGVTIGQVDLGTGHDRIDVGDNVTLTGNIIGGDGNDIISIGYGFHSTVTGSSALQGNGGDDFIGVGQGSDFAQIGNQYEAVAIISGGDGNDTLAMMQGAGGKQHITDGGDGSDRIFAVFQSDADRAAYEPGLEANMSGNAGWSGSNGNWVPYGAYSAGADPGSVSPTNDGQLWFRNAEGAASNIPPTPTGMPCFTAGTLIETDRGPVVIETLVPGDLVMTRDNGLQPLRWMGQRRFEGAELADNLRPILIRKGALAKNKPSADLLVSPQHRVLVRSHIAQKMFGTPEVLVAAKQLLQIDGIDVADVSGVTYVHMLFDQHEVVISNGAETESLFTGPEALVAVGDAGRQEIFTIFPELAERDYTPVSARVLASGRMGRRLAVRHAQNDKPLVS